MPIAVCPTSEQLLAFHAGRLRDNDIERIAHHLETCSSCQTKIGNSDDSSDPLVRSLRKTPPSDEYATESACRRAIASVGARFEAGTATHDPSKSTCDTSGQLPPTTLGKYQLLGLIGSGGMGTVYKAIHPLLKRTVALKVLPAARLKDPLAVSRFRREIEGAGRLDHPNIVRASDADEVNGQHFLVMEFLEGDDLHKVVASRGPLPVYEACEYIRQAALGLEYAHRHELIHRDVKPSNLLLTRTDDGVPIVKVLDLGLALLRDATPTESELTSAGQVMGTYDFIAPEQAMESHTVDARADMYSLGCTFYFLITGHTPFEGRTATQKLLAHQLEEPTPIAKYRKDLPAAVMAIVKKMMAKPPAQRFATMRELAEAVENLDCKSLAPVIDADSPAPNTTGSGAVPRNRLPFFVTLSVFLLLLIGGSAWIIPQIIIRITDKSGQVREIDIKKDEKFEFVQPKTQVAEKKPVDKTPVDISPPKPAKVGEIRRYVGHHDGIISVAFSPDGGSFVSTASGQLWLWDIDSGEERIRFPQTVGNIQSAAFSPDGQHVIGPAQVGTVVIWDAKTKRGGKTTERERFNIPSWVEWVCHSPDRNHIFYTCRGGGRIYDLNKKADLPTRFVGELASLSKNGRRLLTGDVATLYLWDVDTGNELSHVVHNRHITRLALAADGRHALAAVGQDVYYWDMEEKKELKRLVGKASVYSVAISPDGKQALTGGIDKKLRLWDLKTGSELHCFDNHTGPVSCVAFSPDGQQALSGSGDKTVRLWQLPTPASAVKFEHAKKSLQPLTVSEKFADAITHLAVSDDGTRLLTYAADATLSLSRFEIGGAKFRADWTNPMPRIKGLALHPNGKHALLAIPNSTNLSLIDTETQKMGAKPGIYGGNVAEFSFDGRHYLVGSRFGGFALIRFSDGGGLQSFLLREHTIQQLRFSVDGDRILSSGDDNTVRLWNSNNGDELKKLHFPPARRRLIALSPNGKHALISQDDEVQVWDLVTGKAIRELTGHAANVTDVAYGPDGTWAISASNDRTLRIWDLANGMELAKLDGHSDEVTCVVVAAQGRLIFSASRDKTLRAWTWSK